MNFFPIVGRTKSGATLYYTGRAGAGFVSPNAAEAFGYQTIEGARRRATMLNTFEPFHGVWFIAPTGDIADQVRAAKGGR